MLLEHTLIMQIRRIHTFLQYGNFTRRYSPTLIQGGTREIFLCEFIRLYQALDQADIPVKLDIYEGMAHVHQYLYKTPESKIALSKMNE
jgi:monoterpene epsilon-lactone hydrolase